MGLKMDDNDECGAKHYRVPIIDTRVYHNIRYLVYFVHEPNRYESPIGRVRNQLSIEKISHIYVYFKGPHLRSLFKGQHLGNF